MTLATSCTIKENTKKIKIHQLHWKLYFAIIWNTDQVPMFRWNLIIKYKNLVKNNYLKSTIYNFKYWNICFVIKLYNCLCSSNIFYTLYKDTLLNNAFQVRSLILDICVLVYKPGLPGCGLNRYRNDM